MAYLPCNVGGGMKRTVLWTNPNLSSSGMSSTTITVDDYSSYDYIEIAWTNQATGSTFPSNPPSTMRRVSDFNSNAGVITIGNGNLSTNAYLRMVSRKTGDTTKISVSDGYTINSSGRTVSKNRAVPLYVYGIKI